MAGQLDLLALPPWANQPAAYQATWSLPRTFVATHLTAAVPGDRLIHLLSLWVVLTTSAAPGTREMVMFVTDSDGAAIAEAPVGGSQPAGIQYVYAWSTAYTSTSFDGVSRFTAPLPPFVLYPPWLYGVTVNGLAAGDVANVAVVVGIVIPTQGTGTTDITPVATPVLV